jgi:hypothetical protein
MARTAQIPLTAATSLYGPSQPYAATPVQGRNDALSSIVGGAAGSINWGDILKNMFSGGGGAGGMGVGSGEDIAAMYT